MNFYIQIELYNDISNCHTAIQEQYHKEIITSAHRQSSQQDRLFSYVHNDDVSSIHEVSGHFHLPHFYLQIIFIFFLFYFFI